MPQVHFDIQLDCVFILLQCLFSASAKVDRKNKINVRMVDLNKIMSTSTIPKEIDLGPMSPPKRTLTDSVGIHSRFVTPSTGFFFFFFYAS